MHRVLVDAYMTGVSPIKMKADYTKDKVKDFHNKMVELYGYSANVEVGDYTYGMPDIKWWGEKTSLQIGKFCSIAKMVTIFLGGEHQPDFLSTYSFLWYPSEWSKSQEIDSLYLRPSKGDVVIGNDVWIGHGVTILSGVNIGDGAVIGANSLVVKDVPSYTIYGGNPAKCIRDRFDDGTKSKLLDIKWWNWSKDKINDAIPSLLSNNPDALFDFHIKYEDDISK